MTPVIETQELCKTYYRRPGLAGYFLGRKVPNRALRGVSLKVGEGEIFGLLGPNGAGKTTFLKILSTQVLPTSGAARIYGHDVVREERRIRSMIGIIHSDERSFFWRLTGRQNLEFFAALFGIPGREARRRIRGLLELVDLEERADEMFQTYSTGMKQKLAIARGLLPHPRILFMDEALRSVDPVSTQRIRAFVRSEVIRMVGGTVVVATNRLDEAAELCDRVAILRRGRLVAQGSQAELARAAQAGVHYEIRVRGVDPDAAARLRRIAGVRECRLEPGENGIGTLWVSLEDEAERIHGVLRAVLAGRGRVERCDRHEPSLESVFHQVVGRPEEEA